MIQMAGYLTLAVALVILGVAAFVYARARQSVPNGNASVYRVRKYYAAALAVALLGALAWSLPHTPYGAYSSEEPAMRVEVIGRMWFWEFKPSDGSSADSLVIPLGKAVEFEVTAADVNHGFGIYDSEGHLVGQTQAMPGYTNRLRLRFDEPGHYSVLCMEYCGMVHHMMINGFTVR